MHNTPSGARYDQDQGAQSGCSPDDTSWHGRDDRGVAHLYLLHHRHEARECPVVFAAWKGFASPLRHRPAVASCAAGGHTFWWTVEAETGAKALEQLPRYVAERTTATEVSEVEIP
jgi:hypothetical protein